jgi:hypothetical protein
LVVAAPIVWTGGAVAAGVPQVRFPRDNFAHPRESIEWWYFTALVHDGAGRRFSVFFTLFASRGLLLPAQVRDLQSGALVGQSEQAGPGRVARRVSTSM